jgi:hypothetical protein
MWNSTKHETFINAPSMSILKNNKLSDNIT